MGYRRNRACAGGRFLSFIIGTTLFLLQISSLRAQPISPATENLRPTPPGSHCVPRDACRFLAPIPVVREGEAPAEPVFSLLAARREPRSPDQVVGSTPPLDLLRAQKTKPKDDDEFGLKLPKHDRLFRLESEPVFLERLRKELPNVKNVEFPKDVPMAPEVQKAASFPPQTITPVWDQVCYRPLYFEDKKVERFGDYTPCVQPLLSASKFYFGVVLLPCRMVLQPPWQFECDNR